MTRKKLTDAIAAVVGQCGVACQTGFTYRIAPELRQLPAAWLHPPVLVGSEGRREGFRTYAVALELIGRYGDNAEAKEEQWDALETLAVEICALLGERQEIQAITGVALSPAELSLTARGEQSLKIDFKARMPFCTHCDDDLR